MTHNGWTLEALWVLNETVTDRDENAVNNVLSYLFAILVLNEFRINKG